MSGPDIQKLYEVTEATWPPARQFALDPWIIRDGAGGGKRVGAATLHRPLIGDPTTAIEQAEDAMLDLGQPRLFMIREGDDALDRLLSTRGYEIIDPVHFYTCPVENLLTIERPRVSGFPIWEPLAIMEELWAEGGIGPERLAIMQRVQGNKSALMGRKNDRAAGAAFVAIHEGIAMLHALEVTPSQRRQGVGRTMMSHAALWASQHGATTFSLIVTQQNLAANALYSGLGMAISGRYHYRRR